VTGASVAARAAIAAELGVAWLDVGDAVRADEALRQARELYTQGQVEPSVRMATTLVGQARLHLAAGRAAEAEQLLTPLAAAWQALNPDSDWHGETLHWLARAEARLGRTDAAQAHRTRAAELLQRSRVPMLRALATAPG
jgi:tetratricopeptide (TPR) repeat protein